MSSTALPISLPRFAAALSDLPISSLHAKIDELHNAITHLEKSNKELEEYAIAQDDKDCYEALVENRDVVKSMQERIALVEREIVEVRGLPLQAVGSATATMVTRDEGREVDGDGDMERTETRGAARNGTSQTNGEAHTSGTRDASTHEEEGVYL
jgi:hypothetical protein